MAVEKSHSYLEIPPEVTILLASLNAQGYFRPVWSLSKHTSGYSLKLFWKSEQFQFSPNSARPASAASRRRNRNKKRMEDFISMKKAAAATALISNQAASERAGEEKVGSPIKAHVPLLC